jgi:phage terminase large subunit-like protein
VWDVIQTGTPARRNPLTFAITTAGHDRSTICWEQHEYSRQIVEGAVIDDSFFAYVSACDENDDPFDPATWRKSNPNLGVSVQLDYLELAAVRAKASAGYENTFRNLHLNQWTEQAVRWLPMHLWDAATEQYDEADLEGRECFGGLDLASTRDVTAFVLVFPSEDGYRLLPYFWVPEDVEHTRSERDRRQVMNWASRGFVRKTSGNVTDYAAVRADIEMLASRFQIRGIGFDPWQAMETALKLGDAGLNMEKFGQGIASMSGPTREFERLLSAGKLKHNGNPVLRWMAGNVAVWTDTSGNIKPNKGKSADKIDGIVASIMGLGLAMNGQGASPTFYDTHELEMA